MEIIRIRAENETPSDECKQFTASMSKELTQCLHAVNDPTAGSDPSEGSKGSEASQATVSGDSSKSPEISVVEWPPAVAGRLGEAMTTGDEAQKEEFEKELQEEVCFLKERTRGPHSAWRNGEPQSDASRNETRQQKRAKVNEVAADSVLKEAVKSPRDEQHEAASEQMKQVATKEEDEEETNQDGEKDGASGNTKAKLRRSTRSSELRRKRQEEKKNKIGRWREEEENLERRRRSRIKEEEEEEVKEEEVEVKEEEEVKDIR